MAATKARKPRPFGMIEERSPGAWWIRISVTVDGKQRTNRYGPYPTRQAAEVARAALPQNQAKKVRWDRMSHVDQWLLDWSAERVETLARYRRESYARSLERSVRLHLAPALSGVTFDKLDPLRLDVIWKDLQRQGKARATIRNIRGAMSCAMREARRQKLIDGDIVRDSPLESVHGGEQDPAELRAVEKEEVLNVEQLRRLRDWCLAHATSVAWALPMLFIIETGARRAEALGAAIKGVDVSARTIEMRHQISSKDGGLRERRAMKSRKSRRTIGVSQVLIDALRPAIGDRTDGLVFVDSAGRPLDPESFSQYVRKNLVENTALKKQLGLPDGFTLHRLRHTHASMLLAARVPVSVVAGRLGHSSPVVTQNIYTHFIAEADMLAADTWSDIIHDDL